MELALGHSWPNKSCALLIYDVHAILIYDATKQCQSFAICSTSTIYHGWIESVLMTLPSSWSRLPSTTSLMKLPPIEGSNAPIYGYVSVCNE